MSEYTVTMRLNDRDQFLHFVDTVGPVVERLIVTVKNDEAEQPAPQVAQQTPAPARERGARGPRGSKVNTTILAALDGRPKTVKELKTALEDAGLAAGSLSTGLALLQRSGQVERIQDGLYGLKNAQMAAE